MLHGEGEPSCSPRGLHSYATKRLIPVYVIWSCPVTRGPLRSAHHKEVSIMAPSVSSHTLEANIRAGLGKIGLPIFAVVLLIGAVYALSNLVSDLEHAPLTSVMALVLLGVAPFTALGFAFVKGFHDTANAVATVIYTHALEPHIAVVWSGFWNFLAVLLSSGAVAFGIISLLPVELILKVGGGAGMAMVFA